MKKILLLLLPILMVSCDKQNSEFNSAGIASNTTGKNGSLTRFAIKDNLMYTIDFNYVKVFDITNNNNPKLMGSTKVNYGLETITIYGHNIYLGANDGVYILDINNPTKPISLQKIEHHISCDPVVVQGNYAYSTQRVSAVGCGSTWFQSALAVYNVTSTNQSNVETEIPMITPYGLSVEGNWLFVCDEGRGGIVVFDITQPNNPVEVALKTIAEPRDIITMYPYMIVSTKTNFQILNYANPLDIIYVNSIALN